MGRMTRSDASSNALAFRKMNGLGNDFVVLDARQKPVTLSSEQAIKIADRKSGPGCDQIIVLEPSRTADVFMRIRNADGSEVDACGNATRCVAWLLAEETGRPKASIETKAGLLMADVASREAITVDMGEPRFRWDEIPLRDAFQDTRHIELQIGPIDVPVLHSPSVVNVGNPHAIFWVDEDPDRFDLGRFGPMLEHHPIFPERANISLAWVTSRDSLKLRTWERGAGLTRACGTAACAAGVSAARIGLTERRVTVHLPGGPLVITWTDVNRILMSGPAQLDYVGSLDAETLRPLAAVNSLR